MCYNKGTKVRETYLIKIIDRFKSLKPKGIDTMAINGKKITKVQMFNALADYLNERNPEQVLANFTVGSGDKAEQVSLTIGDAMAGLEHEVELLGNKSKKSGSTKKVTDAQVKMEKELLSYMADFPNELFTATTLVKRVPEFGAYPDPVTTQKITPRLTALEKEGKVSKTKEKGKTLWKYVAQDEFEEEEDEA
jgi:C1A family cysteine protease